MTFIFLISQPSESYPCCRFLAFLYRCLGRSKTSLSIRVILSLLVRDSVFDGQKPRRGWILKSRLKEPYHASGINGTKLISACFRSFQLNSDLRLETCTFWISEFGRCVTYGLDRVCSKLHISLVIFSHFRGLSIRKSAFVNFFLVRFR